MGGASIRHGASYQGAVRRCRKTLVKVVNSSLQPPGGPPLGAVDAVTQRGTTKMTNSTRSQWHRRRLHPQRANGGPARDPRADPRPGPRLYDDSPDAASSTYAVASAQSPASEAARTAPHPPGGPPPEEADGAVYILPPSTPLFQPG